MRFMFAALGLAFCAAPALAETGYGCRFDVLCDATGCIQSRTGVELARAPDRTDAWIFLTEEATGIEALALTPADAAVQVFVMHVPGAETSLFTLYPDGRAVYTTHAADPATAAVTGHGFCEAAG